ncbi:MAG TPA: hypothetical protein VHV10_02735 [Ktedonobacteraceae bacterium]|jgi:hypothetical protein|nr:hypothetical protein [Ktedonobacteraceae bacterium]
MIKIGKQWYADNFPERSRDLRNLQPFCSQCLRIRGEVPSIIQLPLLKSRKKKRKKKGVVLTAHHPNYDTLNPEAELIILCLRCHGKAQRQHNAEVLEANKKQRIRERIERQKVEGQLQIFNEHEYLVIQVDFPVMQFLQAIPPG